jgi:hypothetical protein
MLRQIVEVDVMIWMIILKRPRMLKHQVNREEQRGAERENVA